MKPPRPFKPRQPAHGLARLTLTVNGTNYALHRLPCDPGAATAVWALKKSDGTTYTVASTPEGLECSCPDFVFYREGIDPRGCKHVAAMTACGLLGDSHENHTSAA